MQDSKLANFIEIYYVRHICKQMLTMASAASIYSSVRGCSLYYKANP